MGRQVLEKAIQKAVDGGWDILDKYEANKFDVQKDVFDGNYMIGFLANDEPTGREILQQTFHWSEIIFNHDFAKALWGEGIVEIYIEDYDLSVKDQPLLGGLVSYPYHEGSTVGFKTEAWQYHLQQMVIADDPIAYLHRALN